MGKKFFIIILVIGLVSATAGVGTMAWFTSKATSENNEFNAGTLIIDGDNTTEPSPLFKTDYGEGDYSNYNVGLWYPGKKVIGRNYTVENTGSLPAKIVGVSASVTSYKKDGTTYEIENFNNWPTNVKESYSEFITNLNIVVEREEGNRTYVEYFNNTLESLINGPQPLKRVTDNYIITLNNSQRTNLEFGAEMLTSAGNSIQDVEANVNFTIHSIQNDDVAVNDFLND